jgi:DNA-directed RNA polymerase specialized sigma24 family protein
MAPSPSEDRKSPPDFAGISTNPSELRDNNRLALRYSEAIRAYATALLKDPHEAEDVHMTVVQGLLRGDFTRTDLLRRMPKGRFRYYVRRAVRNAVLNHLRGRSRRRNFLQRCKDAVFSPREPAAPPPEADMEEAERTIWSETVLKRAMEAALKELESYERGRQGGTRPNVYHTLARLLIDRPDENRDQLARRLGETFGGEFNANQTRGIVLRMREKLAELLVEEIRLQLDEPTLDNVYDELGELGLLAYVKPYLPADETPVGDA